MENTMHAAELTTGEVLIIREALEELKGSGYGLPCWMHELADEALYKMKQVYEKPEMDIREMKAEIEKERRHWEKGGIPFLVEQMARSKEVELRFFHEITEEERL